jgi:hypothetical protein
MFFVVSYQQGIIGVFSSLENVKSIILNQYKHIKFIIQVFSEKVTNDIKPFNNDVQRSAWLLLYRDTEYVSYVTEDIEDAKNVKDIFNSIGYSQDDNIDYWKIDIDIIPDTIKRLLDTTELLLSDKPILNSDNNIIYYN